MPAGSHFDHEQAPGQAGGMIAEASTQTAPPSNSIPIDFRRVMHAIDLPVAVVDEHRTGLLWASAAWSALFADPATSGTLAEPLSCVEQSADSHPMAASDTGPGLQSDLCDGCVLRTADGRRWSLQRKSLSATSVVLQLVPHSALTDDVHDYMQAREDLFSTSRSLSVSEMAMTLAHEINTPIGTVSNMLLGVKARLRRPEVSPEVLERALDKALEQVMFTSKIVARIRDFTQARRPERQCLCVNELVRESIDLLDWMFRTGNVRVACELSADTVQIMGDRTMLQQVLVNLLKNAVEAMREVPAAGRFMRISVSVTGKRVRVTVRDHGTGLDAGDQSAFTPFVTRKPQGMGVGLNICRSFVELHQGRLWLGSADTGCVATVELPAESPIGAVPGHSEAGQA